MSEKRFSIFDDDEVEDVWNELKGTIYCYNEEEAQRCENWLNNLHNQNQKLKDENERLRFELETHKHPLWSTREAERKLSEVTNNLANEIKKNGLLNEEINQLRIENMRLKKKVVMVYE